MFYLFLSTDVEKTKLHKIEELRKDFPMYLKIVDKTFILLLLGTQFSLF